MKANITTDDGFDLATSTHEAMDLAIMKLTESAIKQAMCDLEVGIFTDKICLFGEAIEGGSVEVCSLIDLFKERLCDNPESYGDIVKFAKQLIEILSGSKEQLK